MKYLQILFCLMIVSVACKSKKPSPMCESCEMSPVGQISVDFTDTTFDQFAKKILKSTKADTAFFFTGYTREKTICEIIGCYQKEFGKIEFDDRCGLLIVKFPSKMNYLLVCDSNLIHVTNAIYPHR